MKRPMKYARQFDAWWNALTLKGDPIRRPYLTDEAFEAGYEAGKRSVYDELAEEFRHRSREQL